MVDKPLIVKIDEPSEVGLAAIPLVFSVEKNNMGDLVFGSFFKLTNFSSDQVTFIHSVAHLAATTCFAPILLDLPNYVWITKSRDRSVEVASRNMQVIVDKPRIG